MKFILLVFFLVPLSLFAQQDTLNQLNAEGERTGFWKEYYKKKKKKKSILKLEGYYENGLKNGPMKTYHPNGKVKCDCMYANDKLDGTIKTRYKDGTRYEVGDYSAGILNGVNTFYYRNGRLGFRALFKDGLFIQGLNEFGEPFKKDDPLINGTGILYGYDSYGNLMIYYYFIDSKEVSYKKFTRYKESLETNTEE